MDRFPEKVPFGYEPPAETAKGTLFIYDSFATDGGENEEPDGPLGPNGLRRLLEWAEKRFLSHVVLYVPHEETLKRMGVRDPQPLHEREDALRETSRTLDAAVRLDIDVWERKRKKYTPMDTALRHMTERYAAPYFIGLSGGFANRFASYPKFATWIRRVRLVAAVSKPEAFRPHPLLIKYRHRCTLLE